MNRKEKLSEKEKSEKQKEIMSIKDRAERIRAIARNIDKKAR